MERKSSVHMRTLSQLGVNLQSSEKQVSSLAIPKIAGSAQDVTGLAGRLRLQKQADTIDKFAPRNWMDKQRKHLQAYEYLCHIAEAKEWIESCIGRPLDAVVELEERLRDGVALAQLAAKFKPELVPRIFEAPRLQFRHSDNINRFFKFITAVKLPITFQFELTDLYEKKNIPKVIYCIHALSFLLAGSGQAQKIGDLVGKLDFTEDEIQQTQRSLAASGVSLPNFKGASEAFSADAVSPLAQQPQVVEPTPQPDVRCIEEIQAYATGVLLRRSIARRLERLDCTDESITQLQACSKGFLTRKTYYDQADTYCKINKWAISLQSAIRGYLLRNRTTTHMMRMNFNEDVMTRIQAFSRGLLLRNCLQPKRHTSDRARKSIIELQSLLRGRIVRQQESQSRAAIAVVDLCIVALQAQCNGRLTRLMHQERVRAVVKSQMQLATIQAYSRALLCKRQIALRQEALRANRTLITACQAICRGNAMRKSYGIVKGLLVLEVDNITQCAAVANGCLVRARCRLLLLSLDRLTDEIVDLQAACLGFARRTTFQARLQHYKSHMKQIIKVQSIFRAKQQGAAYRSLIEDRHPPISTIKNFVHLLDDNAVDFEEEVATEQARRQIVQMVHQNELAEEHIKQMDIKIALLVKQAIKIDEVIQHQRRLGGVVGLEALPNPNDLRAMNKTARTQLENYQRLFYVLQTQPVYLTRLYTALLTDECGPADKARLDSLILAIFGQTQQRREEYYFVKFLRATIILEVSNTQGIAQFTMSPHPWESLYHHYMRRTKQIGYLRQILAPIVTRITSDDSLDLESDPCLIHKTLGRGNPQFVPVDASTAINDPATRQAFVTHLRDLRDLCDQLLCAIEETCVNSPFGLRYLVAEGMRAMQEHLAESSPRIARTVFGELFYSMFLEPALQSPDVCGVHEGIFNSKQRRNLVEVARLCRCLFKGQYFDGGSFLAPLNHFIDSLGDRIHLLLATFTSISTIEEHFEFSDFEDVVATKRPALYLKAADIYHTHSLLDANKHRVVPENDDIVDHILADLGPVKQNHEDLHIMGVAENEILLHLDPTSVDVDDPEADGRVLFMHTKRLALYLIRIQSRTSFLDVLVEPVEDQDEQRWQAILVEEHNSRQKLASDFVRARKDLSDLSFAEIKRDTLENILKLEELGWVSRDNGYQDLINSIAQDIRTQNRRRIERRKELASAKATLQELAVKQHYLESQHLSYNNYIEQAMLSLQGKKGKRKSILPFTKQFFHLRDLQRAGSVPKFGSRKYSAYKLYTKGVLLSIRHESAPYDKFDLVISSHQIGLFAVEVYSLDAIFARTTIQLDELLQAQFNKLDIMEYNGGQFKFTVGTTLNMLFKHFFN